MLLETNLVRQERPPTAPTGLLPPRRITWARQLPCMVEPLQCMVARPRCTVELRRCTMATGELYLCFSDLSLLTFLFTDNEIEHNQFPSVDRRPLIPCRMTFGGLGDQLIARLKEVTSTPKLEAPGEVSLSTTTPLTRRITPLETRASILVVSKSDRDSQVS